MYVIFKLTVAVLHCLDYVLEFSYEGLYKFGF